ncbi:MAG: lamin tail domain-containing protein [Candidatus Marinimicrobia bacterium]|nr:lamin tail domain-containing protein [Candidatus Neomarinimicrobiota bacterium]
MKLRKLFLIFLLPILAFAQGHLILTEMVLQPSAGEYVKIKNPTGATINLSNYYITDATDTVNGKYYYKLPDGADYWSGGGTDFIARFPAVTIAAGETITLSLATDAYYFTEYGDSADLHLKGSGPRTMLQAVDGVTTIGVAPYKMDNIAETLILFYWDGSSAKVQDVDYLIWGSTAFAVDKSGVGTYFNDTPVGSQSFLPVHIDGEKLIRLSETEGSETTTGGNGITGHDETSEPLATTWDVVDLASSRPEIGDVTFEPAAPNDQDSLYITATVTDATGGLQVECVYTFDGVKTVSDMLPENAGDNDYGCMIMPLGDAGTFTYYVRAENSLGLKDSTLASSKNVTEYIEPNDPLTIAFLRENFDTYEGQSVTVNGYVTVEGGVTATSSSSGYLQDNSGRGINVFGAGFAGYERGRHLSITGILIKYISSASVTIELTFPDGGALIVEDLGPDTIPEPEEFTCKQITGYFSELEGTLVKVHGKVIDRADGIGGGSNITIDDGTAPLTLRVWDTTNLLSDATADSLLSGGSLVELSGIVGSYNGSAQLVPAYAIDVDPWTDGTEGTGNVTLSVAPFPFVPKLGEIINYSYEFPDEARVIIRMYDAAGRYVTTLTDEYHGMSWVYEASWNGRNELNQLLPAGTYLMHMEVIERSTGRVTRLAQPVVIAVKN